MAVEKLLGLTGKLPKRTEYVRVIVSEMSRMTDHLTCIGASAMELGAFTAFLYFLAHSAEISVMGAEGMVGIAGKKLFGGVEPPAEVKKQLAEAIQVHIDIYKVAGWGLVDDVIDPRDTRRLLALRLELSWNHKVERPARKRSVMPV